MIGANNRLGIMYYLTYTIYLSVPHALAPLPFPLSLTTALVLRHYGPSVVTSTGAVVAVSSGL